MEPKELPIRTLPLDCALDPHPLAVSLEMTLEEALSLMVKNWGQKHASAARRASQDPPLEPNPYLPFELAEGSSYLVVLDGERVAGIVTERDFMRSIAAAVDLRRTKLGEVTVVPAVTVRGSEIGDTFALLAHMHRTGVHYLPVLDDCDRLLGVATWGRIRRTIQPLEFLKLRRVADVMATPVIHVPPCTPALELAQLMSDHRVSCIVIVQEQPSTELERCETVAPLIPIGIVVERDILHLQQSGANLDDMTAETATSHPLFTVHPQDTLWTVHQQMQQWRVDRLVVAGNRGELLGIVTPSCFLNGLDLEDCSTELKHMQALLYSQTAELQRVNRELARKHAEQERLEQQLKQTNQALEARVESRTDELLRTNALLQQEIGTRQQAEQLLRAVFERALESIAILDDNGQFVEANPSACQLFGNSREELIGQYLVDFLETAGHGHPSWSSLVSDLQDKKEIRLSLSDGQMREAEFVPILNFFPHCHLVILQDITERKQAEQELSTSEACYREVVEAQTELVLRCTPDYAITFVNAAYCQFRGKTESELIGDNILDSVFSEDRQLVKTHFEMLSIDCPVVYTENRRMDSEGHVHWHQWTEQGIFNERGELVQIQSVARDITARKQVEEALEHQYRRSQLVAEITHKIHQTPKLEDILHTVVTEVRELIQADRVFITYFESDCGEKIVAESVGPDILTMLDRAIPASKTLYRYWQQPGQKRSLVVQDLYESAVDPQLRELLLQAEVKACLIIPVYVEKNLWGLLVSHQCDTAREWQPYEVELLEQLSDPIGIAISQAQLLGNLEQLVEARTSELLQANASLEREIEDRKTIGRQLRRSREQLRLVTDALPILIAYIDRDCHYRLVNKAYEVWFGTACEEIVGCHLRDIFGEQNALKYQPHIERVLFGQRTNQETEIFDSNGREHWVNITYIPHISGNGKVKGFFSTIEDISERKKTERMKDEFIATVSHELRTPLTSIHGSIKLLATGLLGSFSDNGKQMLEVADKNCDRLVRLVNDILDLQRMDSATMWLNKKPCDVRELIDNAVVEMQGIALQKEIEIVTQAESISLVADADTILQTITNLLGNAIKFSQAGSTVWLTACKREEDVLFQVKDEGEGIPADKLKSIFERFNQVDATNSRKKGGTGLGLSICQKIVEMHGGKIWVESSFGMGSSFFFSLPLRE